MLTKKQHELLCFIQERTSDTGISPSFDEMKDALNLKSKSGVHRLITALEERGFLRRLPNRARALEIVRMPGESTLADAGAKATAQSDAGKLSQSPHMTRRSSDDFSHLAAVGMLETPVLGRIAAGTPIEAIQHEVDRIPIPATLYGKGEHYILEVDGESMINAGIHDGDYAVIKRCETASSGDIIVALVDGEEATLKRLRKKGASVALEPANELFETRIYGPERVAIQGRLVGLMRRYN